MAETTTAARLNAVADRLEELLGQVTPGSWYPDGPYWHHAYGGGEETELVTAGSRRLPVLLGVPSMARNSPNARRAEANVRYAAAMGPDLGLPLVVLLREKAAAVAAGAACEAGWLDVLAALENKLPPHRPILDL